MTFKWTYLFVAVVLVAAVAAFATTGGALANSGYAMGLGLVLLGGPASEGAVAPLVAVTDDPRR